MGPADPSPDPAIKGQQVWDGGCIQGRPDVEGYVDRPWAARPSQPSLPCERSQLVTQRRVVGDRRSAYWGSTPEPYPRGCDSVYIISSWFLLPGPDTFHPWLPLGTGAECTLESDPLRLVCQGLCTTGQRQWLRPSLRVVSSLRFWLVVLRMRKPDKGVGSRDDLRAIFKGRLDKEAAPPCEDVCEVLGRV